MSERERHCSVTTTTPATVKASAGSFFSAVLLFVNFFLRRYHHPNNVTLRSTTHSTAFTLIISDAKMFEGKHMKRIIVCVFIIKCVILRKKHPKNFPAWVGILKSERVSEWEWMARTRKERRRKGTTQKRRISCSCYNSVVWTDRYARCRGNSYTQPLRKEKSRKMFFSRLRRGGDGEMGWGDVLAWTAQKGEKMKEQQQNNLKSTIKFLFGYVIWLAFYCCIIMLSRFFWPVSHLCAEKWDEKKDFPPSHSWRAPLLHTDWRHYAETEKRKTFSSFFGLLFAL